MPHHTWRCHWIETIRPVESACTVRRFKKNYQKKRQIPRNEQPESVQRRINLLVIRLDHDRSAVCVVESWQSSRPQESGPWLQIHPYCRWHS